MLKEELVGILSTIHVCLEVHDKGYKKCIKRTIKLSLWNTNKIYV